ncbi:uncharacterized protein LOC129838911 isoform X2 [Salvelinus fontinalis]|uniref:uncharacterized protein LOC129838911 isoform X2 n=1 Tax=Salvelinus fontinalis TaxID=8038 RepID=UPI0024852700|nr:uncharacterized protein LOC129838911 isoform X2 [Salvelinus fontinalis]
MSLQHHPLPHLQRQVGQCPYNITPFPTSNGRLVNVPTTSPPSPPPTAGWLMSLQHHPHLHLQRQVGQCPYNITPFPTSTSNGRLVNVPTTSPPSPPPPAGWSMSLQHHPLPHLHLQRQVGQCPYNITPFPTSTSNGRLVNVPTTSPPSPPPPPTAGWSMSLQHHPLPHLHLQRQVGQCPYNITPFSTSNGRLVNVPTTSPPSPPPTAGWLMSLQHHPLPHLHLQRQVGQCPYNITPFPTSTPNGRLVNVPTTSPPSPPPPLTAGWSMSLQHHPLPHLHRQVGQCPYNITPFPTSTGRLVNVPTTSPPSPPPTAGWSMSLQHHPLLHLQRQVGQCPYNITPFPTSTSNGRLVNVPTTSPPSPPPPAGWLMSLQHHPLPHLHRQVGQCPYNITPFPTSTPNGRLVNVPTTSPPSPPPPPTAGWSMSLQHHPLPHLHLQRQVGQCPYNITPFPTSNSRLVNVPTTSPPSPPPPPTAGWSMSLQHHPLPHLQRQVGQCPYNITPFSTSNGRLVNVPTTSPPSPPPTAGWLMSLQHHPLPHLHLQRQVGQCPYKMGDGRPAGRDGWPAAGW